jgi:hypothetical protein
MNYVRENGVSPKSVSTGQLDCGLRPSSRLLTALGIASGVLILALNLAPVAFGQSQSGSSSAPPAQPAGQTSGQASATAPAPGQNQNQAAPASQQGLQDLSAPTQSLGDAARKARAEKPKAETTKVYTEDKLSGLSGHGISSVGSGSRGGGSAAHGGNSYAGAGGGNTAPSSGSKDETYWRGRAGAIRDQMAELDREISRIQDEIKEKGAVSVDPMSGASVGVIYIEDRNRQIKQIEAQKAKLQSDLETLAEEGRKAGADSGWFR